MICAAAFALKLKLVGRPFTIFQSSQGLGLISPTLVEIGLSHFPEEQFPLPTGLQSSPPPLVFDISASASTWST